MPYDTVAFHRDPQRRGLFEADLPVDWLSRSPRTFLAVEWDAAPDEVAARVQSGVKLLATRHLDRVLQGVVPGIRLDHVRTPPTSFPKRAGLHFFSIDTDGDSRESWAAILEDQRATVLSTLGGDGEIGFHLYVELSA